MTAKPGAEERVASLKEISFDICELDRVRSLGER